MRLEKGLHRPSAPMLARIAEETGVPAAEIANGTDPDEEEDALPSLVAVLEALLRRIVREEVAA